LWSAPPPYSGRGRPRKHGDKFKLNDPQTWGTADEDIEVNDPDLGRIRIRLWRDKHFQAAAEHPMQLVRVERLEQQRSWRISKPLWLAWLGEQMPPVSEVWRLYLRRFAVDHWYRFAKQGVKVAKLQRSATQRLEVCHSRGYRKNQLLNPSKNP
jgi:hypothetical protein